MVLSVFVLVGLIFGLRATAHIVDNDGRLAPGPFFLQPGVPSEDAFSASGSLYCGRAGIDVTAQVVLQNDLLLTSEHVFFNRETKARRKNLELCYFTPFFGELKGQRFRLRLDTLKFYASHDHDRDLALVRLDLERKPQARFYPYPLHLASGLEQLPQYLLSSVDGGARTTYDFSPALQSCAIQDTQNKGGGAIMNLFTDCDIQNHGPSGGALLLPAAEGLAVTGILTGFYGTRPAPYGKYTNSTVFVGMTKEVIKWISAYAAGVP